MSKFQKINLCNFSTTEIFCLTGSVAASITALVSQQTLLALTSFPLAVTVGLNSWNRKHIEQVNRETQAIVINLQKQYSENKIFIDETISTFQTRTETLEKSLVNLEDDFKIHKDSQIQLLQSIAKNYQDLKDHFQAHKQDTVKSYSIQDNNYQSLDQNLTYLNSKLQGIQGKIEENYFEFNTSIEQKIQPIDTQIKSFEKGYNNLFNWKNDSQKEIDKLKQLYQDLNEKIKLILPNEIRCEYCSNKFPFNQSISGGEYGNYEFCSENCKIRYNKKNGC